MYLFRQTAIAVAGVQDDVVHQAMRIKKIAYRLLKLALQSICLAQTAQIKVQEIRLRTRMLW